MRWLDLILPETNRKFSPEKLGEIETSSEPISGGHASCHQKSPKKGPFQKEMSHLTEDVRSFFRSVLIIFTAPAFDRVFFFFKN